MHWRGVTAERPEPDVRAWDAGEPPCRDWALGDDVAKCPKARRRSPRTFAVLAALAAVCGLGVRVTNGGAGSGGGGGRRPAVAAPGTPLADVPPVPAEGPSLEGVFGGRADGTASYVDDPSARRPGWAPWSLAADPAGGGCLDDVFALYCTGVAGAGERSVARVDAADGAVIWNKDLHGELAGVFDGNVVAVSPVPGTDLVTVAAYDTRDGSPRWAVQVPGAPDAEVPAVVTLGDGLVFVAGLHGLTALALADGSVTGQWRSPFAGRADARPVVRFADHRAYLAIAHGTSTDLTVVDPNLGQNVRTSAELPYAVSADAGFAVHDGVVDAVTPAGVAAWDSATGAMSVIPLGGAGPVTGFAVDADTYVVQVGADRVRAVRGHEVLWDVRFASSRIPGALWCAGGRVYTIGADGVTALDASTGAQVWHTAPDVVAGGPGVAQATVSGGVLFVRLPGAPGAASSVRALDVYSP